MDGVDPADIQAARDAALAVDGVEDVAVRGRWMGRSLVLEVEARLIPGLSLEQADKIGSRVRTAAFDAVPAARAQLDATSEMS